MKLKMPPLLFLVVAIVCWSFSPSLISAARIGLPPAVTGLAAVCLATLVFVLVEAVRGSSVSQHFSMIRSQKQMARAVLLGFGAFVVYPSLYFSAIQLGDPLTANIVNYLWPVLGLLITAMRVPAMRSLELFSSVMFGFAGSSVAFLLGSKGNISHSSVASAPANDAGTALIFAACGALTYAFVSAFAPSHRTTDEHSPDRTAQHSFFVISLLAGGAAAGIGLLLSLFLGLWSLRDISLDIRASGSFALYSVLLPLAHLSWLRVVQDRYVPSFASVYLVPVLATIVLGLWLNRELTPGIVSALALVTCGITFSIYRERRIPVALAVTIGAFASVLTSQSVSRLSAAGASNTQDGASILSELLVSMLAIFGGFVLTNAINRYNLLVLGIGRLYAQVPQVRASEKQSASEYLENLESRILQPSEQTSSSTSILPKPTDEQRIEAIGLELLLQSRVSNYEWLVLVLGAGGLISALHIMPLGKETVATLLLKSTVSAVAMGVLFAIRDYDLHRPGRLHQTLATARSRVGLALPKPVPQRIRSYSAWYNVAAVVALLLSAVAMSLNIAFS